MAKDYTCPSCKAPLTEWKCKQCGVDIRELFKSHSVSNDEILQALTAAGMYYRPADKTLVICGHGHWNGWTGGPENWDNHTKFRIWLAQKLNCALNTMSVVRLDEFWVDCFNKAADVPHVAIEGRRPMLLLDEDTDKLYFPTISSLQSRFFHGRRVEDPFTGKMIHAVTLYQGPPLVPQDHGGLFEKFLQSLRCLDEDNRHVVRTWCYSVLLAHLVPEGQFPSLIVASNDFGSGKSTTAECLMEIFGGGLSLVAKQMLRMEDLVRMMLTPDTGFLLADNLRNEGGKLIDDSDLAGVMTMKRLSTKTLYKTAGSYTLKNRTNFLLTANQPMFSPELLSRMMATTLRSPTPEEKEQVRRANEKAGEKRSWEQIWLDQRRQLLEDVMWNAIQNWNRGEYCAPNCPSRFVDWWRFASRLLGRAPTIMPHTTALYTPLQRALALMWKGEAKDRLPVSGIVDRLRANQSAEILNIMKQATWTDEKVTEDLKLYGQQFQIDGEQIVKRY